MINSSQKSSLAGKILYNRYKIIKKLGEGGFGQTFLAEDIHMPQPELCVVKQLNPPSVDPQIVAKCQDLFKKEAKALQDLGKHCSSIPELKAYFIDEQHWYLVQEYIEGETLDKVILEATEDHVIKIIQDVGNTLIEVHQNNRIHRDIKPENLILRNSDNKIVLIDFGVVKEITTQIMNNQSVIVGTSGYISPEQAKGQPCYASDIYSLGIVAIEKLTKKNPVTLNFDEQRNVHWRDDVPVGVSVSDKLTEILNKMTRSSLKERYSNLQQVLIDLQTIKDDKSDNVLNLSENSQAKVTTNSDQNVVNQNVINHSSNSSQSQPTQIIHSSSPIKKILIVLPIILLVGIGVIIYKSPKITPSSDTNTPESNQIQEDQDDVNLHDKLPRNPHTP